MSFFAHLAPLDNPNDIVESIKLPLGSGHWVYAQLAETIKAFLAKHRDDGNKVYAVRQLQIVSESDDWVDAYSTGSFELQNGADVFATLEVQVDASRHVQPLSSKASAKEVQFETLKKYTYSDGDTYVKVDLPIGAGVQKEMIQSDFHDRSFEVRILGFNNQNLVFGVKKLQCRILPPDCSVRISSKGVQVKLRKKKADDNWHSLFHSPAIGEVDSD